MKQVGALLIALVLGGVRADAQEIQAHPGWAAVPSIEQYTQVFPSTAREGGISGIVGLECASDDEGELVDCIVLSEDPSGYAFGQAALDLSSAFRTLHPVSGRFRLGVRLSASGIAGGAVDECDYPIPPGAAVTNPSLVEPFRRRRDSQLPGASAAKQLVRQRRC